MMRTVLLLSFLVPLSGGMTADAAAPLGGRDCAAVRDAALARIAQEEEAVRAMLDADAAVLEAPTYRLTEAESALQAEFAAARARVHAEFRSCLRTAPGPGR